MKVGKLVGDTLLLIDRAFVMARDGHIEAAISDINAASLMAQALRADDTMMESLHVPDEHLLAIFTPLLLPLLLPLILGLFREVKRYKTLRRKKMCSS